MKKISFYCFLFVSLSSATENPISPVHVVYSHGFGESAEKMQLIFQHDINDLNSKGRHIWEICKDNGGTLTFNKRLTINKILGEPNSKDHVLVGDDGVLFSDSSAMNYAFLGNSLSMFNYPDAPGKYNKAVFYTKPAVHALVNHLYDCVIKKNNKRIILVGRSCGGGTAYNCLDKLINYDQEYFAGSQVKSNNDAEKIITAINQGAFICDAPLLSLEKVNAIINPSRIISGLTATGIMWKLCGYGINSDIILNTGLLGYCIVGNLIENIYKKLIISYIVPMVSNGHYDAQHQHPINIVNKLHKKLNCPILLHFNEQDGVIADPDDDTIKVYKALKNSRTHILISSDGSHNFSSDAFEHMLELFQQKYFSDAPHKYTPRHTAYNSVNFENTQPTIEQLKKKIYPHGILSKIWKSTKWPIIIFNTIIVLQFLITTNAFNKFL